MKKGITITVLFILLVSLVTGCGGSGMADISSDKFEGFSNTEYNPETDFQYFFSDLSQAALAGNGYYVLGYDSKLYYLEKGIMQPIPACSKIDCSHDTYDCDAYIDSVSAFRYYDGYLYYIKNEFGNKNILYRRTLDSLRIEKVCDLIKAESTNVSELGLHRGYMCYSVVSSGGSEDICTLYRVDLDKGKIEKVYEYKAFFADLYRFIGYGDGVLFIRSCALDKDYTEFRYDLCYYDYTKNRISVVIENSGGDYAIADDNIYYYSDGGVYRYDIMSGNKELFYSIDEPVLVSYDGKYLYFNNIRAYYLDIVDSSDCRLYITDMQGNLIDTVSIVPYCVYYGDTDYMFQQGLRNIEYLDKSKIGAADNDWTEIGINSGYN